MKPSSPVKFIALMTVSFVAQLRAEVAAQTPNIVSAVYGEIQIPQPGFNNPTCHRNPTIDLTTLVQQACSHSNEGTCSYTVPIPPVSTDPGMGCYKSFTVSYQCGSEERSLTVGGRTKESATQTVSINCADNHFQFTSGNFDKMTVGAPYFTGIPSEFGWKLNRLTYDGKIQILEGPPLGEDKSVSQTTKMILALDKGIKKTLTFDQAKCLLELPRGTAGVGDQISVTGNFYTDTALVKDVSRITIGGMANFPAGSAAANCMAAK